MNTLRQLSGWRALYVIALIISDLIMLRLAFVLAYHLRALSGSRPDTPPDPPSTYDDLAWICALVISLLCSQSISG